MPIKLDPVDYDPFEVAPDQFQYEPVDYDPFNTTQRTTAGDYSRSLALGLNRFGQTVGRAIDVVGNLDPTRLLTKDGEGLVDRAGQAIESFYQEKEQEDYDALSPAMKDSMQLRYTEDTDKTWKEDPTGNFKSLFAGDAWKSPSKIIGSLLQSAPSTATGMGVGGAITHKLIKQGIKGLSSGMAGVIGGFIGEGGTASIESGKDIYDMVVDAPHDVLSQTEEYQKAWNGLEGEGMSIQARDRQARELVADHAAMKTMAMVFSATGALGSVSGHYMGKLIGGEAAGGLTRKLVTGGGTEALQEAPQSGFEILVNNIQKKKYVNPEQDIWEGVKEGSVEGSVQGGIMGIGMSGGGAAIGRVSKNTRQNLLDDNTGFSGEDLSATPEGTDTTMDQAAPQAEPEVPEGSQGPTAEEQQWMDDIQAQRDGTYQSSGMPIEAIALGARQQRQAQMERQEALEQEALRREQEALNSPGTHINQGQDEVDRGIAEFRRLKQQEEELRRIQAIRSGQTDEVREQRAREAEEAKREEQRRQFFEREEQRIEGGTALAGWKAPEPIRRNEYAPSKAEQARRQAMFEAKARELGDIDPSPDPAIGQPIEKEIPRGLPTPAFGQPRALRGLEQDQATESSEQQPDRAMAGYQEPKTPEAKAVEKKIEQEVKKVDTAPTDGQKEAGNYRKGHIRIEGHDISIENPDGSVRSGVDNDGNAWESRMTGHYGYIKRTTGKDGDNVDVVVAPGATASPKIFVVDQVDPETFEFDEHKVMFGVDSKADAEALYLSNYDDGWEGFGGVTEMSPDEFKAWVGDKDSTTKPLYKDKTLTPPKKGEVKALQQSGDQTIDISVASDVGVAPTKPRVSKESFNKAISEQSHNENSPLNKYLFTEDTPENIEYILSGKSKHPRNLVYWQQGRLHHNSPNKSVIVLDVSKIDPSKLQTERDGVGEYLIDAKDIRGAVVGSYKNQYQLRDNFTDLVDNTPAAPDASAPSGVAPAESSQSDSRAQAINDFVESMVAPDLKRARENGIDVSQEQIDKVKNDQRARTEEFVDAIEAKDFGAMKDRLHRGNKASLKLFSAITGLSTRTQKETDENIRALDPVKYDEWVKSKKQKFDKAVANKKAADKEKAYKAMLEAQTNYDSSGKPITFEQHIKNLLDNGYTDIEITEGKFPTTKLIKHENGGKGRVLKSQIFRKKIEQEYVQKMRDQYSEKRIAEDLADEEKDRAENPDKYLSDEETEHLFTRPGAIKSLVKKPSLAQEMTDKMESMNDLIKSKGYTTRGEKGGRKTLIKDGKDVFTGTFSQVEQWIKDGEKPVESKADLKDDGTVESPSSLKDHFKKALASGRNFKNIVEARKMAREEFGVDAPAGSLEAKNIDEAMESASVEVARDIVKQGGTKAEIFDRLVDLQERMPSLNVRTSTSIKNQAYSTPLPLAYLASELAGVTGSTTVYEPSAGNGALVVGANPKNVTVNELNPDRVEFLSTQGFKDVVNTDGTVFVLGEKQDIVIGNPPFGTIKNDDGVSKEWIINPDYKTTQIDHAMVFQALKSMKDTGKAVFIIGSVNDKNKTTKGRQLLYRNPDKVRFFKTLYDNYNVVDHFSVAGKLYSKQGASWPVDFIVIDGKGKSPLTLPGAVPPQLFTSIEELKGKLNERTETLGMGSDDSTRVNGNNRGDLDTGGSHSDAGELSGTPGGKSTRVDSQGGKPEGGDRVDDGKYERPGDDVRNAAVPDKNSVGGTRIGSGKSEVPGRSGNDGNIGGSANETANQTQPSGKVGSGKRRTGDVGEQSYGSIEEELANTSEAELDSMLDDVFGKEEPPATTKTKTNKKPEVKVGQAVKKATIESLAGVQEAVKGLGALFTPKNTLGSGPVFNEETYEAARPHFEKAWEHAKEAGFTIKQLIQHLAGQFDSAIRPYLKRFLVDQQTQDKPTTKGKASPKKKPSEKIESTDTQTIYTPSSKSSAIGTLVPANMSRSMEKALAGIEKKYGSIDKYVADKLGYTEKEVTGTPGKFGYFSGEQVDAIALAIDNIDKGSGFIIGDQTGVGKGRVVAAMIRYSLKKGLTPIFVTEKPNLYSDMYRDLSDIGMADMADKILMTNANETVPLTSDGSKELKTKAGHNSILKKATQDGELPGDYKIVFTTYAQMNATNSPRRDFMDAMSKGSMIIMDEAHNAGGTEGAKETGDKYPRSLFFRKLVRQASSVFYSSATYAKRPGTMDLYSKTDMSLAVEDINTLGDAIAAGGVPLQQVVAAMLAAAGQYVRRERSFKGIAYDTTPVKIDKELSNRAAKAFAEIRYFSETFAEPAIDAAGDAGAAIGVGFTSASSAKESSITSISFTSVMHNLVGQMLLSMKTQGAVDEAIRVFKEEGKKPVITLANTMGSFIADYASQNNLVPGDAVGLKFNDLIFNYLDKTRWYTEDSPFKKGKKEKKYIQDSELSEEALREFNRIKKLINEMDLEALPISPVDYIKAKLEEAGMTVSEITGRTDIIKYAPDGTQRLERRSAADKSINGRLKVINGFNTDVIDALILNQSGSTGLSLHSLPKFEGHKPAPRHMIILQAEGNIDTHMQMLGRINRAGQVNSPSYSQLVGDTPAEKRPAAILAAKMASLNANTTAAADSEVTAKDSIDFINKYGDQVVAQLMQDFPDIHISLGSPLPGKSGGGLEPMGAARKVTGKIPMLPYAKQKNLYDMILSGYQDLIDQLDAMGENDLEAKTFETDAKVLKRAVVFEKSGQSPFQSEAVAEVVDMKKLGKSYTSVQVRDLLMEEVYGKDAKGQSIEQLVKDSMDKTSKTFKEALSKFEDYSTDLLDNIGDDARRQAQEAKLRGHKQDWMGVAGQLFPGKDIQVTISEMLYPATVIKVEQTGNPKNPLAMGTWKATMAVADSSRRLTFTFGKLLEGEGKIWDPAGQMTEESLEKFDQASQDAREERTIITGNMLAAYSQYKSGRIINYTTSTGKLRQGILMPRGFDLAKANKERPVIVTNAEKVMKVLNDGKFMKTDGDLVVSPTNDGRIAISAPASKAKGSKYFLNSQILKILGQDFVKTGNRMKVVFSDTAKVKKVVDYVLKEMNETFMNTADAPRIRALLGMETDVLRDVAGKGQALYSTTSVKPWPKDFPKVYNHTNTVTLRRHPDHKAGKAGDKESSARVAADLIKVDRVKELGRQFPNAMLVAVHAEEETGRNQIPSAIVNAIGSITGLKIDGEIVQSQSAKHTKKNAAERCLSRAEYDGTVVPGQEYIIVDDVVSMGGTVAELRHYIENNGGKVVAISSLAYSQGSGIVALQDKTLAQLKKRFNKNDLEKLLQEYNVAGTLDAITESEGRYLLKYGSVDSIRDRFFKERQAGSEQVLYSLLQRESSDLNSTPTSPGKAVTLPQIKKWFKGQAVTINDDGSISVRLKNGAGLRITSVQQVSEGKYLLSTESGKMDQNGLIAGKYLNNEIELVEGVANGKTLSHEVEHWLEDIGVITPLDKAVIDTRIKALDKNNGLTFQLVKDQRENRANFLSEYLAQREQYRGTPLGRLLQKVADFLDAMVHLGRSSVRKVARGIESGQIFSRETKAAHRGKVQNSTTLNTDTKAFLDWFKGSKVVDKDGKPLVVYHGTRASEPISVFSTTKGVSNWGKNQGAFFFSDNPNMSPDAAAKYVGLVDEKGEPTSKTIEQGASFGVSDVGGSYYPVYLRLENPMPTKDSEWVGDIKKENKLIKEAKSKGHDGLIAIVFDSVKGWEKVYIVFEPTQIKSVYNRGTWSPTDPRIQYSTVQNDQKENEKIVKALFKQKKTFTESVKDMADKAKSEEERQLAKDKVIANTLDNLHFIKTRLGDRVYKMHRVLTGIKSATFARFLLDGSLSWVGDALQVVDKGKGVIPFLQSIGPDYQNLFLWIAARRAEQLEAEGREFWLTKDKRDAIDAKVGTHAKSGKSWESLNKRFQTINKNVLDIAEQAGLINAEGRAMWESDFYIPFYRIFENEATKAEFLSGPVAANKHISAQIRRLKGSEAKIGDLLENSMANWMHLVDASARNKAKAAAFEVGVETGIFTELTKKDLVNVLGVHNETRYAVMKPGGKQASSIFDTKEEAEAWAYTLSDKYNKEYTIEPRKNTIIKFGNMKDLGVQSFQKDGKPVYFKTDDVDLYNSMCELDAKQFSSFIMKMFGGSKRLLTKGATFGTMFRINNALRDTLHTSIVAESFVPFVDTAIGFAKSLFETKEWREMMSSGFGFGSSYIHSDDPQAGAKYVRKIIAREGRGALSRILHSPGKILEVWEKIGTASENAARVQHYSRLRKKGMSVFDAGFEARDLMDFSMRGGGDSIQLLTRTLPFLGARIQGNYKLGRAAKKNPVRFLLKGSMLTMASLALWGAFKDDDRYKELPDWDKFLFMHFWIGDKHFRIPSPFEVGVLFCSLPVTIANIVNGNEDMKFLGEWAKTSAGDVFGIDITPQLTKPLIELTTNKNTFTGRKIVPDYMEGLPKPEQYHHYTSETAREIGKRLNVSPLQVEHLIRGYTSTMGMMALSALDDAFVRDLFGYPSRAKGGQKPWGVSRLVSDAKKPATSTKYLTGFYESAKQVADAKRTYNHYLKTTQLDKAADILKEKGLLMALSPATNKIKSRLALINDEMRRVQRSNEYTPSEKEKRLDVLMSERNRAVKAGFEGIRKAKAKQKVAG